MKNFSLSRFGSLIKLYWISQSRTPYIVLGVLLVLSLVILSFCAIHNDANMWVEPPFTAFIFCFWISCITYAGLSFSELQSTRTAVSFFTLPASNFEKWLAKLTLAFVVFPIIVLVSYQVVLGVFTLLSPSLFAVRFRALEWTNNQTLIVFFLFFLVAPLVFLSGLIWRRYGLLKTIFSVILFLLVIGLCVSTFETYMPDTIVFEITMPFGGRKVSNEMLALNRRFWFFLAYLPSMLLLVASYFLIKEYEI